MSLPKTFLNPRNKFWSIYFIPLFDIYRQYVSQIQGYRWWNYRQDIERYR